MKIISFKKKKVKLLTKEQQESHKHVKICYIGIKKLKINMKKIKNILELESQSCHYTAKYRDTAHSICNLKYSVPKNS